MCLEWGEAGAEVVSAEDGGDLEEEEEVVALGEEATEAATGAVAEVLPLTRWKKVKIPHIIPAA